jgi:hypothetical protein
MRRLDAIPAAAGLPPAPRGTSGTLPYDRLCYSKKLETVGGTQIENNSELFYSIIVGYDIETIHVLKTQRSGIFSGRNDMHPPLQSSVAALK